MLSVASLDRRLNSLLGEDPALIAEREQTTFDRLAHPHERSLVLVGAGYMGGKALRALRADGIEPLAFADDNARLHGREIDGVPVFSIADAAARFSSSAAFVVTLLKPEHPFVETRARLQRLGCERVISAIALFWKYPAQTMPHAYVDLPSRLVAAADDVGAAYELFADDASRREYVAQVAYRMRLDVDGLPPELPVRDQYFPADLIRFRHDERFVDCGAFDGDTVRSFIDHRGDAFTHVMALEPDPDNYTQLERLLDGLPPVLRAKIEARPFAVGDVDGTLRFDGRGTNGSLLSSTGRVEVACRRLDTLLASSEPTYIKMDIEGAELDALAGVRSTCARVRPVLAVCVYHAQDHLWKIPLRMQALSSDYTLFLRAYMKEGMELVCYAVPKDRLA